jgi:CDP-glycerol glycerophosphotransferase
VEPLLRRYAEQLGDPVDERLAVFGAYWFSAISCNPRAIHEKLGELAPDVRRVWVVNKRLARSMPADVEHVVIRTEAYFDLIAHARWFVNNVNFPDHLVKRPGTVHIQTHHGTPLKLMGLDQVTGPAQRDDIDADALRKRSARWDYSIASNRYSTEIWRRAYDIDCESLEYGYPRNDVLATATAESVSEARQTLGIHDGRTVVLFAPTHREHHSSFVPTFDIARFAAQLGSAGVLLTRLHYAYGEVPLLDELHRAGAVVDVSAHSVEQACLAADILITDYSSVMFDYAVLDRPIVVHVPDWEEYQCRRGTYFDLVAEPPGVVTRDDEELSSAFLGGAVDDAPAQRHRAAFRDRFCQFDDGNAAERVVRHVWGIA